MQIGREVRRNSNPINKLQSIIDEFTNIDYLTRYSLYSNLYASQLFSLQLPDTNFMPIFFSKKSIDQGQLYEYNYFHKRDKKLFIFYFIMMFLLHAEKSQLILMENMQRINCSQLQAFIVNPLYGGKPSLLQEFKKRIHFYYAGNIQIYKFNLQYLNLQCKTKQFVKCIIVSDINSFENIQKSSLQKYYRKIPSQWLVISFKRELNQYKFIQKHTLAYNYQQQEGYDQRYQLNEKVIANLNRKACNHLQNSINYLVPIQNIGVSCKTLSQSYKSAIIRKNVDGHYYQFTFTSMPYKIETFREIK